MYFSCAIFYVMNNTILSRLFLAIASAPSAPVTRIGRLSVRVVSLPDLGIAVCAYEHDHSLVEIMTDDDGVVAQVWDGVVTYPADRPSWAPVI